MMRKSNTKALNELRTWEYISIQDIIPIFKYMGIDTAAMTIDKIFELFYDLTEAE